MTEAWTVTHLHFPEIESTQEFFLDRELQPREAVLVTADRQTHGHGRGDRQWLNGAGNFLGTWILPKPEAPQFPLSTLSLLAAVAVLKSVKESSREPGRFSLKWPNDVLLNQKKLAGILLTATRRELRIGCGVNLMTAPIVDDPSARQAAALGNADSQAWLTCFSDTLFRLYDAWLSGNDQLVRGAWQEYGEFGTEMKLRDGRTVVPLNLGEHGELWVREGTKRYACFVEEII